MLLDLLTRKDIVWRNVALFSYLHVEALIGLWYFFTLQVGLRTFLWGYFVAFMCMAGVCSGVHRLWSHRAYKAALPLRALLCFFHTIALQNSIYEWCRDHRLHHVHTDTQADPHNSTRGFFFSHMGWLLVLKHPDVKTKGKTIDLSDLKADPVVMFQKKYYIILAPIVSFIIPVLVPIYFWGERFRVAWTFCVMFRYAFVLHGTWTVNSAAHIYGTKPYDKNINPRDNIKVSWLTMGEGWHNYHHIFPWDYKAAELRHNWFNNFNARFIEFMARIGMASDLKSPSDELVERRARRTGDGSRGESMMGVENNEAAIWGWDDSNMKQTERREAEITHQRDFTKVL